MDARSVEGKQHGNQGASICANHVLRMLERAQSRPFLERFDRCGGSVWQAAAQPNPPDSLTARCPAPIVIHHVVQSAAEGWPPQSSASTLFSRFFFFGGEKNVKHGFSCSGAKVRFFSHLASIMRLGYGLSGRFFRLVFQPADLSAALPRCRGGGGLSGAARPIYGH